MVARGKLDPANFKPGPQNPQKYPQTGANYAQWGDVKGMQYDPWSDSYYKDKKAYEEYLYTTEQAERPKEAPGLFESVAPLAVAGGALALSQGIGESIADGGLGGFFGMGGSAAPAATQAAGSGVAGAASNLTGLQGLGAGSVAAPTGVEASLVTTAPEAGGLMSGIGGLGLLPTAAIAGGTYLGGKAAYDMIRGKEDKSTMGKIGRGLLGVATGGISEIARPFAMHKSTREETADKTNELLEASNDPRYQSYVQGMREQYKEAPKGPAYAGMFNTFDEYKKAGLRADDLTGVYGNIKAYGPQWAGLTFDQQKAVTQLNINDNLYDSSKGDVVIKDEEKAKQNLAKVLGGQQAPAAPQQPQGQAIPRPIANKDAAQKALESWK